MDHETLIREQLRQLAADSETCSLGCGLACSSMIEANGPVVYVTTFFS
jgi:hypothetical protein